MRVLNNKMQIARYAIKNLVEFRVKLVIITCTHFFFFYIRYSDELSYPSILLYVYVIRVWRVIRHFMIEDFREKRP